MKPTARWIPYLLVAPAFAIFSIAILGPIIATFGLSLTDWDGFSTPSFVGLKNFNKAFADQIYMSAYWHAAVYILATLFLEVVIGLLLAGLVSAKRNTTFYRVAFFTPVMLPLVVISVLWSFLLNPDMGILNRILGNLGLESWQRIWLGDQSTALLSISVISGWIFAGFYMAIFYAGFQRIPSTIIESARLDGASEWQLLRKIKIPMIKNLTEVAVLLCFTGGIQIFDLVYVLTNGGPYDTTQFPTTYLVRVVFRDQQMGYGSALAVILTLVVVTVALIYNKLRTKDDSVVEY
ncbi:sugar ABC transporter permease [freshwater metagenome]|uniref:Sugar ABC transporter permease n=1 Tax=freshwater metagenome TaxID=449393 RepID=A0A094QAJ9_9ZZZZ